MSNEHNNVKHRISTTKLYKEVHEKAKDYITNHVEVDMLTLGDFCTACSISRRQAQRALAWYNTSWRKLLNGIRMYEAAKMLRETQKTPKEVARAVGYRQPAQFAKAFRRHHGLAPSAFRDARRFRPAAAIAAAA
jgi:AraC-like DNA-binding protein